MLRLTQFGTFLLETHLLDAKNNVKERTPRAAPHKELPGAVGGLPNEQGPVIAVRAFRFPLVPGDLLCAGGPHRILRRDGTGHDRVIERAQRRRDRGRSSRIRGIPGVFHRLHFLVQSFTKSSMYGVCLRYRGPGACRRVGLKVSRQGAGDMTNAAPGVAARSGWHEHGPLRASLDTSRSRRREFWRDAGHAFWRVAVFGMLELSNEHPAFRRNGWNSKSAIRLIARRPTEGRRATSFTHRLPRLAIMIALT